MMKAMINNKVEEIKDMVVYEEYTTISGEQVKLYEVTVPSWGHDKKTIINANDLIQEVVAPVDEVVMHEVLAKDLIKLIDAEFGVDADTSIDMYGDVTWVYVEGMQYQVNICIDEDGYALDTINLDRKDSYSDDEDFYKNQTSRKTVKGVMNYIKRFIG